ncbi:MAG: hypothetical protein O7D35_05270 [Acidobacteria bacterium]|nr:hypothetical protein [Acidobacteriota bacterium]
MGPAVKDSLEPPRTTASFRLCDEMVWKVAVSTPDDRPRPGPPQQLFRLTGKSLLRAARGCWEISADGQRFYFIRQP